MSYPKPLSEKSLNRLYMQAGLSTETCAFLHPLFAACANLYGTIALRDVWSVYHEYLCQVEDHASRTGWVSPLTREDKEYFAYLRQVSKRYNIDMSKANRLEYNFVIRVAESEFYAHHTS